MNRLIPSKTAAIIATVMLLGYAVFQFCLILGLPWGHYAWGGQNEILPIALRIGSAMSILIYLLAISLILSRARIIKAVKNKKITYYGTWVFTIYFFVGILMNAVSRSPAERYNVPFILVLTFMFLIVAKSEGAKL